MASGRHSRDGARVGAGLILSVRMGMHPPSAETATRPSRGRSAHKRAGQAMAAADYFPAALAGEPRLSIARQNSRRFAILRRSARGFAGCQPVPPVGFRRHEGREGRGPTDGSIP